MMQTVFGNRKATVDGTDYFEMKYFLTQKQRQEVQNPRKTAEDLDLLMQNTSEPLNRKLSKK